MIITEGERILVHCYSFRWLVVERKYSLKMLRMMQNFTASLSGTFLKVYTFIIFFTSAASLQ